jgi:drug/metabolite transporter (DMT)-like permease
MKYLIAGGLLAGGSTFFYYLLAGHTDASTILPYGQLVIIYLLLGDLLAEKDIPTIIEVQCIVSITLGVLLVGVTPGGFDIPSLLIVLGPMNVFSALYTYLQRRAKRMEIRPGLRVDSLNMRLWTLLFMNVSMSLMMLPLMTPATWTLILQTFVPLFWVLLGSALATFLAMVMYVRALGKGKMAVVNSLAAVSVVLGIPVTLLGNLLLPGAFGAITYDVFLWALKLFGVTLIVVGVLALQAADVRSLVLVSVNPRAGSLIDALFDIKGVETAAALAGKHDYLLRVKGRSLTKTRSAVLKKIQKVPGVVGVRTLIVLADYK